MRKIRFYGKYVKNQRNPISFSDLGGQYFNTEDMIKQMDYRGNQLTWTGLMVGKRFADIPNPQNKSFKPKKESTLVSNLRINSNMSTLSPAPILSLQDNIAQAEQAMVDGNEPYIFDDEDD